MTPRDPSRTRPPGPHEPSAEFDAFLEWQIVTELRRHDRFPERAPRRGPVRRRAGAAALVVLSLAVGAAAAAAPAQVQEARERAELLAASGSEERLAALRLQIAREAYEDARRRHAVGLVDEEALNAAEDELRRRELALARIRLEMEEIRETGRPPQDRITAPLAGDRDFVAERLELDMAATQRSRERAEDALAEVRVRWEAGLASREEVLEREARAAEARGELQLLARTRGIRRDLLAGEVSGEQAEELLQREGLRLEIHAAVARLRLVQARLDLLRARHEVGLADGLDVRRAEVRLLEDTIVLQGLQGQLEAVDRPPPPGGR
jgi:hypothetical protein